jgi:hypothetical protein
MNSSFSFSLVSFPLSLWGGYIMGEEYKFVYLKQKNKEKERMNLLENDRLFKEEMLRRTADLDERMNRTISQVEFLREDLNHVKQSTERFQDMIWKEVNIIKSSSKRKEYWTYFLFLTSIAILIILFLLF